MSGVENGDSLELTPEQQKVEWLKCAEACDYFIDTYCCIYDATAKVWIPFKLWKEQFEVLDTLLVERLIVILKARQLGQSWEILAYILWNMLFHPAVTALIFSKRDDEAVYLLDERLKGMYGALPDWMKVKAIVKDSGHQWELSNGSIALAFPTSAGDSYTATIAVVDEADLVPDLGKLMRSVKPTIDGGGQLILLSRSDKSKPQSEFKQIYRAAKQKLSGWAAIFLPWWVRTDRTPEWYAAQKADILHRTGSLDDLHEQYPATDTEALAPRTLDKRIAPAWLEQCYVELASITELVSAPAIPGLTIYKTPQQGKTYVVGIDPAEGNPTSDDSALTVLAVETGEEVANLAGKFQPAVLAAYANQVGIYFNKAALMVERNNHGHAVLLWLRDNSKLRRLPGLDGKEGWLSSTVGKSMLYDTAADAFRDKETTLHSFATHMQLQSIEGSSLRAPEGEMDDRADSYALALAGRVRPRYAPSAYHGTA